MKVARTLIWSRFAAALCLMFVMLANSSMFVLAAPDGNLLLGEIVVTGRSENGEPPLVKVNGEPAMTGRTFPSYSMIETSALTSADLNLGRIGRIGLSQDSILILSFGDNNISGKLLSGKINVYSAKGVSVKIETLDDALSNNSEMPGNFTIGLQDGKTTAAAESGEIFFKNGEPAGQTQTTPSTGMGAWIPVAVFAGIVATAAIYVIVKRNDDDDDFVVSPVR